MLVTPPAPHLSTPLPFHRIPPAARLSNRVPGLPPRFPETELRRPGNGGSSTPATLRLWPVPPARALAGCLETESCSLQSRGQGCGRRGAGDAEAHREEGPPGTLTAASAHGPAGLAADQGHGPVRGAENWRRESFALWEGEYLGAFSKICMSHTSAATPRPRQPRHPRFRPIKSGNEPIHQRLGGRRPEACPICAPPQSHPGLSVPWRQPGSQPRVTSVDVRCSQWLRCFRLEFALGCNARDCGRGSGYQLRKPGCFREKKKGREERIRNTMNILGWGLIWA